ncbi:MAG: DUF5916 domain-containing protein [Gammaproteobacteria bacterium]|nr:DUF5916 domain-containing protein [Gammaproteobacteria bacterium]
MPHRKLALAIGLFCLVAGSFQISAEDKAYVVYASLADPLPAMTAAKLVQARFNIDSQILEYIKDYKARYRVTSEYLPLVKAMVLLQDAKQGGYEDAWLLRSKEELNTFVSLKSRIASEPPSRKSNTSDQPSLNRDAESNSQKQIRSLWELNGHRKQPKQDEPQSQHTESKATIQIVESSPNADTTPTQAEASDLSAVTGEAVVSSQILAPGSLLEVQQIDSASVKIDGSLDDSVWQQVNATDNMVVLDPPTLNSPQHRTLVRMFSTKQGLYVAAEMEQPAETFVQRLSARDKQINRDNFEITLDTSGEGLFGFWFAINLGGTKADGKVAPERSFSDQWDGAWYGESAITANGWTAEMYIPWSILTMPKAVGAREIRYFVARRVAYQNERYGWPGLTNIQPKFLSALQPMTVGNIHPKQSWEMYPYISTKEDAIAENQDSSLGLSFSWRPSSNLQLTGTVSPDFGAVESDDVVVNLTAFETFFPEKRLFFLEGSEVFITSPRSNTRQSMSRSDGARSAPSTYRMEPTTLLNTRRIGGAARHVDIPDHLDIEGTERSKPTDLIGALKVVGQYNNLRYGILTAFEEEPTFKVTNEATGEVETYIGESRNFGVARWLYERTTNGRMALGYMGTIVDYADSDAIVHGIDAHYLSPQGAVTLDTQLVASSKDDTNGYGLFGNLRWFDQNRNFHNVNFDALDDKLDISDLGFLRRNDLYGIDYFIFRTLTENLPDFIRQGRLRFFSSAQFNGDGNLVMSYLGSGVSYEFDNRSELDFRVSWRPNMVDDFYARGDGYFRTEAGGWSSITYGSDSSKKWSWSVQTGFRDGPLGLPSYFHDVGLTFSPVSRFSLDYDLRYQTNESQLIYLGDGEFETYRTKDLQHIFSSDLFVNARQQFRVTFHWIGIQGDVSRFYKLPPALGSLIRRDRPESDYGNVFPLTRLTAQVRYRWEIAPLSDLFVVYTRGSNLYLDQDEFGDFQSLLNQSISEPVVDVFVVKLRYRFGA